MKVKLDDVDYFVEKRGTGFPLLLLHGFTGSSATWHPLAHILEKNSTMIMVDLLGHGKTEAPPMWERYEILKSAADLKLLLDILAIEKVDLLGYSMGGRLAITFAATYPDRVRKLVLESTTPGLKTVEEREARCQQDAKLATMIKKGGVKAFVDFWENISLFQTQKNLSSDKKDEIRRQRLDNNATGLANSLLGMGTGSQPSWWSSMVNFSFETLILAGELDLKFLKIGEEMLSILPNAKFLSIKNAGHAIHVEEPEKFGTIVSRFLSNES
jgi:2-succinyl-6-hydroxy-2,4-cyclohexadiene-1-carboxylate synthase